MRTSNRRPRPVTTPKPPTPKENSLEDSSTSEDDDTTTGASLPEAPPPKFEAPKLAKGDTSTSEESESSGDEINEEDFLSAFDRKLRPPVYVRAPSRDNSYYYYSQLIDDGDVSFKYNSKKLTRELIVNISDDEFYQKLARIYRNRRGKQEMNEFIEQERDELEFPIDIALWCEFRDKIRKCAPCRVI